MKKQRFEDWIVFEDEQLYFVNKPAHLSVLEDRSSDENLLKFARVHHPESQACHRIDKETSGLVIFAKNPEAYRRVSILFETRKITKTYHAVCEHPTEFKDYLINLPIEISSKGKARISKKDGKPSSTLVNTLQNYRDFSLIECNPFSGRLHQIRVHMAAVNHPLAADELYGGKLPYLSQIKRKFNVAKSKEETPMIQRVVLHARGLRFESDKIYDIAAPYPHDFEAFIKILAKYNA